MANQEPSDVKITYHQIGVLVVLSDEAQLRSCPLPERFAGTS